MELATSLGAFAAFPDDFAEPFCEQDTWAAEGSVAWGLARGLAVESSLAVANGLGGVTCAVPAAPGAPPEPGATWVEEVVADGVRRNHFVSTSLMVSWMLPVGSSHLRLQAGRRARPLPVPPSVLPPAPRRGLLSRVHHRRRSR